MAWTPVGGDVLFVEATRMAGSGSLTLTGQLGDVMKESARAALSWVRAHANEWQIDPDFFKNSELHVHVPSGAIPKDGPSAGVTMVTAMVSELTRRPVRGDVSMTGEITLQGKVLPVGGIKEKVLAAKRLGIKEMILPRQNEKNVKEDLGEELRKGLTIHLVSTIDEVLLLALVHENDRPARRTDKAKPKAAHPARPAPRARSTRQAPPKKGVPPTAARSPFVYTSQSATASRNEVSGSRVGTNSCARNPLKPVSAIARQIAGHCSSCVSSSSWRPGTPPVW